MPQIAFKDGMSGGIFQSTKLKADCRLGSVETPRNASHALLLHKHHECSKKRDFQWSPHSKP
jgi:hypothetical protein